MAKILLIEDNEELAEQIAIWLRREQHLVEVAGSAEDAEEFFRTLTFDVYVFDWDLPGALSGLDLCKQRRAMADRTPIIFLTGRVSLQDKGIGFESGADDYLTKPFALPELGFRIKALLRRSPNYQDSNYLKVRDLVMEPNRFHLRIKDEEIKLLPKEFAVLEFLMRHPGEVFSPEALFNRIWSSDSDASPEAVSVCVRRLRKKIDKDPKNPLISNIHGVGYRLDP